MKIRYWLALGASAAAIAGCTSSAPVKQAAPRQVVSVAACTKEMTRELNYSESHPGVADKMTETPVQCRGLSNATLKLIATQVVGDAFDKFVAGLNKQ